MTSNCLAARPSHVPSTHHDPAHYAPTHLPVFLVPSRLLPIVLAEQCGASLAATTSNHLDSMHTSLPITTAAQHNSTPSQLQNFTKQNSFNTAAKHMMLSLH